MIIEERAKQYAKNVFFMSHSKTIEDIAIRAYSKGATEQKQIDIDKACEWLRNNAVICLMNEEVEDFVEDFYKAMEE